MSARKNYSAVWNYFEKDGSTHKANCIFCRQSFSFKSTAANLKSHLKRKHKSAYLTMVGSDETSHVELQSDFVELEPQEVEIDSVVLNDSSGYIKIGNICETSTVTTSNSRITDSYVSKTINGNKEANKARKNPSAMWNHFEKSVEPGKAICNICKEIVSYRSTTANLKSHLKRRHSSAYSFQSSSDEPVLLYVEETLHSAALPEEIGNVSKVEPVTESPSSFTVVKPGNQFNPKTTDSSVNKNLVNHGRLKKQIDSDLLDVFIDGLHSFSLVEERSFRKLMRWIPGYKLPSKKIISGSMLQEVYSRTEQTFKAQVCEEVQYMCITIDSWSSRVNESYIALTGHYLTSNIEFRKVLLGCCQVHGNNSAENIATEIKNLIEHWNLQDKVNFVVSNNAPNVVKAVKEFLGWEHYPCYAQALNSVVNDALLLFEEGLSKVESIVLQIRKNPVATKTLLEYQLKQEKVPKYLKYVTDTGWISKYLMLSRFIELEEAIKSVITDLKWESLPTISSKESSSFSQLCQVLKPFEEVISLLNEEKYLSGSSVIVLTRCLTKSCNKMLQIVDLVPDIRNIVLSLKLSLEGQFKNLEQNRTLSISTFMDPRFKMQAFSDQREAEETRNIVIKLVADLQELSDQSEQNVCEKEKDELSPWTIFDDIVCENVEKITPLSKALKEVEMYLADALVSRKTKKGDKICPFEWWRNHRNIYPNLSKLLIKKCNIVATSVSCDHMFSEKGKVVTDRRARLSSFEVEKLLFLNVNLNENRFVNFM